ncbi:uncharacterized protein [Chironomus tepperi]|uniref:uncharacterized protein n=1 Tax=Chironomus tepperi TaxID=113505 RepID=UPI00391F800A
MKFKFTIFVIFLTISCLAEAFWSDCPGSNVPGPDDIVSPNCSGDRCRAVRGESLIARIYATPQAVHHELIARVTAFVFGIGINLPMQPPFDNACNQIHFANDTLTSCPVYPNIQYVMNVEMQVSSLFPAFTNTLVQVDFWDGNQRAACGQIIADLI